MSFSAFALPVIALAAQAADGRSDGSRAQAVIPSNDVATWVTSDDYPILAWREGRTGRTSVVLEIDRGGRVTACVVAEASGHTDLDDAACRLLSTRATFSPALDNRGRPIPSTYRKRINWQLPDTGDAGAPAFGYRSVNGIIIRFHLNAANEVTECNVRLANAEAPPAVAAEACATVNQRAQSERQTIPPEGIWVEIRNLIYSYTRDPGWNDPEPTGADMAVPSAEPAALPPGQT